MAKEDIIRMLELRLKQEEEYCSQSVKYLKINREKTEEEDKHALSWERKAEDSIRDREYNISMLKKLIKITENNGL